MPSEGAIRVIDDIDPWLEELWATNGTDLLITAGAPPLVRIDGQIQPVKGEEPLTVARAEELVMAILGDDLAVKFREEREIDFAFSWRNQARLRCNAFYQRDTCAMALRVIPYEIPGFDELGIPPAVERLVNLPMGLVIVTGPTGSGKSTTLAAMLDYINRRRACHIVTIEDPIEYVHGNHRSAVSQREVGNDTKSFPRALRSALREDPDVLLVGEMRDLESISTTLTIAETGHLVFATLHTNDSAQAIDRIVDIFPSDRRDQIQVQLASTLKGSSTSASSPASAGGWWPPTRCSSPPTPCATWCVRVRPVSCATSSPPSQNEGMQTLEMALTHLVKVGLIDYETALKVSLFPKEVGKPPAGSVPTAARTAAPAPRLRRRDTARVASV